MSKLISQGGYGCVYFPGIECSGKQEKKSKFVSKLQRKGYNSDNEIDIGEIVMKIKNFFLYYAPVVNHCDINISKIDKSLLERCEVVRTGEEVDYMLMKIEHIPNIEFFAFLTNKYESKEYVFVTMLETYSYLLNAIELLSLKNIVHFDIKNENILFNQKTKTPFIIDFGISLNMNNYSYDDATDYFYIYAPEYYIWPLEVHIVCYLVIKRLDPKGKITKGELEKVVEKYFKNNKALSIFSESFKKKYYKSMSDYALQFSGKTKKYILDEIIKEDIYKTWDNFSLSVLMLRMLDYLFNKGFSDAPFIVAFSQLILMTIHPDPTKRFSIKTSKETLQKIINTRESMNNLNKIINSIDINHNTIESEIKAAEINIRRT